jgi:branched-chain amino acid transport system permease protein
MKNRSLPKRDLVVLAVLASAASFIPAFASDFLISLALTCLMYAVLSSSWALFCGSTRYLSLATSAFFGLGAYTGALLLSEVPWLVAVAAGALLATVVAAVMGAAVLHLRGTYFAVLTFGMTELIRHAVTYFEKQVTGTVGRVLMTVPDTRTVYFTVLGLAVLAVLTSIVVRRSRFGLALSGIGAAMSVRWTYIDPVTVFNPFIGFQTVLIALIGGAATLWGPLAAAVVFSLLAETLRLQLPQIYMMALGLLLILSVLYLPGGLASLRWGTVGGWFARSRKETDRG